jgi:hypothetical protein
MPVFTSSQFRGPATPSGQKTIAIEIKRSLSPSASKGFHIAADDMQAARRYLLYP